MAHFLIRFQRSTLLTSYAPSTNSGKPSMWPKSFSSLSENSHFPHFPKCLLSPPKHRPFPLGTFARRTMRRKSSPVSQSAQPTSISITPIAKWHALLPLKIRRAVSFARERFVYDWFPIVIVGIGNYPSELCITHFSIFMPR